jgi:hypothetical protein
VQFQGAIKDGLWRGIWKAKVENKCRFFIWLLLQARLPTADRIANHGGHANSVCTLCRTNAETHLHMVAKCSYTKAVWQKIALEFNIQPPIQQSRTLRRWWRSVLRQSAADRDKHLQVIIYTVWNVWKERCRRIFQNIATNADQLAGLSKQDVLAYRAANRTIE